MRVYSGQFTPESARYLLAAGRRDEAIETLRKASKMNGKTLPKGTLVEAEKVKKLSHYFAHLHLLFLSLAKKCNSDYFFFPRARGEDI